MKINEIQDDRGVADLDGSTCVVDLSLIEDPAVGDYIIVHAGFAIEKLDEKEANERLDLFEKIGKIKKRSQNEKTR